MSESVTELHSRAMCLLAECFWYAPRHLQESIEELAHDTGKAGMPLRVESRDGILTIDILDEPK